MVRAVGVVAIGRNEGDRLVRCLASLEAEVDLVVYVDSGSTDNSIANAKEAGAEVVELDLSVPFTAARARNAGFARLCEKQPNLEFVQFMDGDCELAPDWISTGIEALNQDTTLAIVCGRRRERFPDASIWNRMIDAEWDAPVGDTKSCGGDALVRRQAFEDVDGYREDLIAGEEPEMCFRMRQKEWRVRRLAAEMTLHDAAMTRMSQWWQRARRAGHTYAEGAAIHGKSAERYKVTELRRTLIWAIGLPLAILFLVIFVSPWALVLLILWPVQIMRMYARGAPLVQAIFTTIGKFPEAQGVLGYWYARLSGKRRNLIEYKSAAGPTR